ncbi:type II toxin-antitoxin system HicA family toxin [Portibacter marinus]|uniref:type II toxin-antitoxin system HicA family toxin n=1 Tax=Portibacter marinus TaxID=2898660 RepID=UPI001F3A467C|nr:type II toxin-antitoxin system HicA family toxin [Portibacter marinus]
MTAKQAEKLVTAKGWYFVRQNGSHRIYKHDEIHGIVAIPFHGKKDLAKGTLNSILKKAQVK